jgi:hypothetical protein
MVLLPACSIAFQDTSGAPSIYSVVNASPAARFAPVSESSSALSVSLTKACSCCLTGAVRLLPSALATGSTPTAPWANAFPATSDASAAREQEGTSVSHANQTTPWSKAPASRTAPLEASTARTSTIAFSATRPASTASTPSPTDALPAITPESTRDGLTKITPVPCLAKEATTWLSIRSARPAINRVSPAPGLPQLIVPTAVD